MLCFVKHMIIIGLVLVKPLFSQADDSSVNKDAWRLSDFVKKSHALKGPALKETKDFLESIPSPSKSHKDAKRLQSKAAWQPLVKNYDELLKKTFRLEDGLETDAMHPEFYIFISFSLPRKTLLALLKASRHYGATLVLRGLKDGSFKKTMSELMELYKQENGRVILDPNLFKKFNITSVPSFLLTQGQGVRGLLSKGETVSLMLRGNVSPRFALSEFGKHAPFESFAGELLQ